MKSFTAIVGVLSSILIFGLLLTGCEAGVSDARADGDKILAQIYGLMDGKGALSKEEVIAGGVDLQDWRYLKIDEDHFRLSLAIGIKKHLTYRSDLPGKFGKGWRIVDDSGNEEWLP